MTDYVETFKINDLTYGIEKLDDGRFKVRISGGTIYTGPTIEDARELLHSYALNQNRAESASYWSRTQKADAVIQQLGTDPFNLGRFRV